MMKMCIRVERHEDGFYKAWCPSLPGCASRGETREQAIARIDEAICGYIAAACNWVPDHVTHEVVEQ